MMLAQQQLDTVPDSFWKNFCMAMLVLVGAAAVIVGLYFQSRKAEPTRIVDDPPVKIEKASKRYNHDFIDARFGRIEGRLETHDAHFDTVFQEMKDMREKNAERYTDIAVSLAEIKVHLGIKRSQP